MQTWLTSIRSHVCRLLEDPGVKSTFSSFRDKTVEELKASTALRSHVLRVMGAVEKVVARLDNEDKLVALLHDLGQRHVVYNARPEFLDVSMCFV